MDSLLSPALRHALLVEDDPVFQQVLSKAVEQLKTPWMTHVFRLGGDAIAFCTESDVVPDLALVDLGLPDRSGVEVIRSLTRRYPNILVMVVSVFADEGRVLDAIRAGASGYLVKDDPSMLITQGIEQLLTGIYPLSPMLANHLIKLLHPKRASCNAIKLTAREHELIDHIAAGKSYAECSDAMGIALSTVQSHVRSLYRKLGAHSQLEAVKLAKNQGLL